MVVHAKKKRGIDCPGLDGLAQDRRSAGFRKQLEPTWRLDADDADHRRSGKIRSRRKQWLWIDRLVDVKKNNVLIGIEVRGFHALDASQGYAELH